MSESDTVSPTDDEKQDDYQLSQGTKTILGSLAGMIATAMLQPLDVVKVRLQIYNKPCSTMSMVRKIMICEGYTTLWTGLSAGCLRQATYTTTRTGVSDWLQENYKKKYKMAPALVDNLTIGIIASAVGAFAGNPSEMALIRLMADGPRIPCASYNCQPRYTGTVQAIFKIARQEGITGLWRGGTLTIMRAISVNIMQLSTYPKIREMIMILGIGTGYKLHLCTTVVTSFFIAAVSFPVDVIKTRYQEERNGISFSRVIKEVMKNKELNFTKGFLPYYVRMAIYSSLTYIIMEETVKSYEEQNRSP